MANECEDIFKDKSVWDNISGYTYRSLLAIKNIPSKIKWFYQRGQRGWADCDVWSVDYYLVRILPSMLRRLAVTSHGHPPEIGSDKWTKLLKELADDIGLMKQILEFERCFYSNDPGVQESVQRIAEKASSSDYRMFTKEEQRRHDTIFSRLNKYFYSLWD